MQRVLENIAERIIAADEPGFTPRELGVGRRIEAYIRTLPPHMQRDIRLLVVLFEYLPPFLIFRPRRFSSLAREDQERYLLAWGSSRFRVLRSGFRILKTLCMSTYYQDPASWKAIGFEP